MPATISDIRTSINDFQTVDIATNKHAHFGPAFEKQHDIHVAPLITKIGDPATPPPLGGWYVSDDYSHKSLYCLVENLECFSKDLFEAFCHTAQLGLEAINPYYKKLLHSLTYSREYVLNAILQQVEIDIDVIKHIADERSDPANMPLLAKLDGMANEMIQWAVNRSLFDQGKNPDFFLQTPFAHGQTQEARQVALTYFGGSKTRTIPYCPVAPIALPADLMNVLVNPTNVDDSANQVPIEVWLKPALAYEVGKLIFWKGSVLGANFFMGRSKLARYLGYYMQKEGYAKWVANAVAGIFADVFMTLQCGHNAAGHAIRRAQPRNVERFYAEDMRYQLPPVLRPYVCFETLNQMQNHGLLATPPNFDELMPDWTQILIEVYGRETQVFKRNTYRRVDPATGNPLLDPVTGNPLPAFDKMEEEGTGFFEPPLNVTVYSDYVPATIGFDEAIHEVKRATKYIFDLLNGLSPSSPSAPDLATPLNFGKWQDGKIWMTPLIKAWNYNPANPIPPDTTYFINAWFPLLAIETRNNGIEPAFNERIIDKATYDDHYRDEKFYWASAHYASGWMMESPGNSGGPH